ncbi:YdcF family protein [Phenylobacterium sp.]|uniref:YdcF family protein n=1 Tax=Phenylobacterium sp. TaxID=1871053 RepID=UPI002730D6C4|nr:YdcF family protein [Phenylobacterium sp.]MDP1875088.1 YdcF family protein [Phenylobacterium sp.]MDP3489379.1 YdcF family protein [Phenylobacterium sp.]
MKTLALLFVAALIWAAGLLAFATRVEQSTPAREPAVADGIVALTGAGSNERIAAGMRLLEAGKGDRMLVSGVNREVSRADIRQLSRAAQLLYDCCVDLGFEAADTFGNAQETAGWVKARRYDSLIVVTADFHMPRAMLELGSALPGVTLQAYPVATPTLDARRWWRSAGGTRLMVMEYSKYLAILGREMVLRLGPKDNEAAKPAAQVG